MKTYLAVLILVLSCNRSSETDVHFKIATPRSADYLFLTTNYSKRTGNYRRQPNYSPAISSSPQGRFFLFNNDFDYHNKKSKFNNDFGNIQSPSDEDKIRKLKEKYVAAWLANDPEALLDLFDDNASLSIINTATGKPFTGKKQLRSFWFPDDSSKTTILEYINHMIGLHIDSDIAQSTHQSYVKWLYEKNGRKELKEQKGFGSALFKKQANGEWKYFHLMSYSYKADDLPLLDRRKDEASIRDINQKYIRFWLDGDKAGVLSLFTDDASIVPSGLKPYRGKKDIEQFWFPNDGSVTKILKFTNDILNIQFDGDIAESSQLDYLSWKYESPNQQINRTQWGYVTTLYKRQIDGNWKIIHQMWKDYKVKEL